MPMLRWPKLQMMIAIQGGFMDSVLYDDGKIACGETALVIKPAIGGSRRPTAEFPQPCHAARGGANGYR